MTVRFDHDSVSIPDQRTAGYQTWRNLTFLHYRIEPSAVQAVLPSSLTVQQFDGAAWLGVVPFSMERIRPWWSPPVPGLSWFLETNVRTYVVDHQGVSGVWFFSLDASSRIAVHIARRFWYLPYHYSAMEMTSSRPDDNGVSGRILRYQGRRPGCSLPESADYQISIRVDESVEPSAAVSGTLEHFLVERYLLFAEDRQGKMRTGQVHHAPYQLRSVQYCTVQQHLIRAAGVTLDPDRTPDHVAFSDGVDVRISPLQYSA
jgi:uncharacterized protein YqjF (DUF2071 family)